MNDRDALRTALQTQLDRLLGRGEAIRDDRRQVDGPLPADWQEQATALENSEVLDSLSESVRREIDQLRGALARLDAGTYGVCARCGEPIAPGRLRALPTATTCIACSA